MIFGCIVLFEIEDQTINKIGFFVRCILLTFS